VAFSVSFDPLAGGVLNGVEVWLARFWQARREENEKSVMELCVFC